MPVSRTWHATPSKVVLAPRSFHCVPRTDDAERANRLGGAISQESAPDVPRSPLLVIDRVSSKPPSTKSGDGKPSASGGPIGLSDRLALRIAEVARVLGISERHARKLLPRLPHCRLGGVVIVPVDQLREWLRDQARIEPDAVDKVVDEVLRGLEK